MGEHCPLGELGCEEQIQCKSIGFCSPLIRLVVLARNMSFEYYLTSFYRFILNPSRRRSMLRYVEAKQLNLPLDSHFVLQLEREFDAGQYKFEVHIKFCLEAYDTHL